MFPYDAQLTAATQTPARSIPEVLEIMRTIENSCIDGLKWFNWLYLRVTQAVEDRINAGGFTDPRWLADLDVSSQTFISVRFMLVSPAETALDAGMRCSSGETGPQSPAFSSLWPA